MSVTARIVLLRFILISLAAFACADAVAADWKPVAGHLMTRWAKDVAPDKAHREFPRPQLVRSEWTNLNGLWEYAIRPRGEDRPAHYDGSILVPFPVESALSGVMQRLGPEKSLWYRRRLNVPAAWRGQQVLLHFEAVDWETRVWIDGKELLSISGPHRGGYSPFAFDITDAAPAGSEHELVVGVLDPSDAGKQPCGKQHNKPEGIWYTPSSGIWQTVWLEPVAKTSIAAVRFESDISRNQVHGIVQAAAAAGSKLPDDLVADVTVAAPRIEASSNNAASAPIIHVSGPLDGIVIDIPRGDPTRMWSPEYPYLYDVVVRLTDKNGATVYDEVKSYFAFRTIGVSRARRGIRPRMLLNGQPIFLFGPLDQGFWPDGLYTAPTDEALRSDLETTKRLGFNFVRKHVKVEPARWYYWCDRLGLAVFQDMPSGDGYAKWPADGVELHRTPESAAEFEHELRNVIEARRFFPCIVGWVPFNEGWGQYDTVRIAEMVKSIDPGRLVDPASGGNDFPAGDVRDIHTYPGPKAPPPEVVRAAMLGEFGGLGLPVPGHLWLDKKGWGYRKYDRRDQLTAAYIALAEKLRPLVQSYLSAAVYTQTTDVETEVNGLMTYDRELIKMDAQKVRAANRQLLQILDERTSP